MSELQERPMGGEELVEIERRLRGRLRAHHLSGDSIHRHLEDAVQKGVVEWLRVESGGEEVRDPKAFVTQAAFRRAIDEMRREARRADGATLDGLLETGSRASSSAEEVVIESLDALELQAAIDSLPAEQRQVLALHYFGELDQKRAAQVLHMSERTFRRRLKETLSNLAGRLGVAFPEQGSLKGMEIGLAAWAGLGGGRIIASSTGGTPVHSFLELIRQAPGRVTDRLRGPGTNLLASETPERIGAVAGGPAGKVLSGCAGAAVVCALSGVVGPGIDLGGREAGPVAPARPVHHEIVSRRPLVSHPIKNIPRRDAPSVATKETGVEAESRGATAATSRSTSSPPARRHERSGRASRSKKSHRSPPPTEADSTEEEFSGISRAAAESGTSPSAESVESSSVQQAAPVIEQPTTQPAQQSEPSKSSSEKSSAQSEFGFEE